MRRALPLLLLVSCARAEPLVFTYVGSDAGLEAARAGAKAWSDTCGISVTVHRDVGGIPMMQVPDGTLGDAAGHTYVGDEGRGSYVAVEAAQGELVYEHEIGHALGLLHAAHGLMAPTAEAHVTPDECARITASR